MKAVERLKRDHGILRSKLGILDAALKMGPETWFVLREICHTLARQLRDHIRREEALVAACRSSMTPESLRHIEVEHRDEPERLRTLNRLFIGESGESLERIRPVLMEVVEGLRRHMDEEEAELFPILERVLAGREDIPAESAPSTHLSEGMTVNRVIQQYPATGPVFKQLFVNVPSEGCDCLDEVAWRHGLESRELLEKLEGVITGEDAPANSSDRLGIACGCN